MIHLRNAGGVIFRGSRSDLLRCKKMFFGRNWMMVGMMCMCEKMSIFCLKMFCCDAEAERREEKESERRKIERQGRERENECVSE